MSSLLSPHDNLGTYTLGNELGTIPFILGSPSCSRHHQGMQSSASGNNLGPQRMTQSYLVVQEKRLPQARSPEYFVRCQFGGGKQQQLVTGVIFVGSTLREGIKIVKA